LFSNSTVLCQHSVITVTELKLKHQIEFVEGLGHWLEQLNMETEKLLRGTVITIRFISN